MILIVMTNTDVRKIDALIKKNLKGVATKKDLTSLEANLRRDIKNDIDDAVIQVISTVDKTVKPFAQRLTRVEEHHEISPFD